MKYIYVAVLLVTLKVLLEEKNFEAAGNAIGKLLRVAYEEQEEKR